jgi:hypothetical protein
MTVRLLLALAVLPQGAWADEPLARQVDGRSFDQFVQTTLQDYAVVLSAHAPAGGYQSSWSTLLLVLGG